MGLYQDEHAPYGRHYALRRPGGTPWAALRSGTTPIVLPYSLCDPLQCYAYLPCTIVPYAGYAADCVWC
eukprot:2054439-Rhodomonas_salina.1